MNDALWLWYPYDIETLLFLLLWVQWLLNFMDLYMHYLFIQFIHE